jgi:cardiolipin synthase A/B
MGSEIYILVGTLLAPFGIVLHWSIVIGLGCRIILKRRPTGVSLAWLVLIVSLPLFGALLYLFVGELWLPRRRIKHYQIQVERLSDQIGHIERRWDIKSDDLPMLARHLNAQVHLPLGISSIGGNSLELFPSSKDCLSKIVEDINNAKQTVSMLFYIWDSAGDVGQVEQALIDAVNRGVKCRVLIDSAGSKKFIQRRGMKRLRSSGIEIVEVLPVGLLRWLFSRVDIRNHRKIITIDHDTAYTGSMNMVDPTTFNSSKKVGQWVDIMARVQGPAARVLDLTLALDWAVENEHYDGSITASDQKIQKKGDIPLQVVPSGPGLTPRIIHDMLLTLIYNASSRIVITTPYFIPSESMLTAITAASMRGVHVTVVVPARIDSILVRHASKSYFEDLLDAGVELRAYTGGLLHAKTVSADDSVAMLGTVNMDKRSFWINFEISLFAYDSQVVEQLFKCQQTYIQDSIEISVEDWKERGMGGRLLQNGLQLLSPIL